MPVSDYIRNLRAKVGHDLIMIPAAAAIIRNNRGEILLQLRGDLDLWGLPGGAIEPGEEPAETVIREVLEETGLRVIPEYISGIYGGPSNMGTYPNGDRFAVISVTFVCRVVDGVLQADGDETRELQYFRPEALPDNMVEKHLIRIEHAVNSRSQTYFDLPDTLNPGFG